MWMVDIAGVLIEYIDPRIVSHVLDFTNSITSELWYVFWKGEAKGHVRGEFQIRKETRRNFCQYYV